MIKRQDIILNKVKELSLQALERHEEPGVTAQEAAELLKMDRGNVSKELNQLAASEKLLKKDGRHWFLLLKQMVSWGMYNPLEPTLRK